ncbi:MAG: OmpA family protein [bacterium]|nr:OmpA family protein [bacterium]MDW8163217.1 OmpA family protein [Candidatus Omnitrophota bacterium]
MNRNYRKKSEEKSGTAPWYLSYGDMVTQLLCFFILLFAMSTIDIAKLKKIVEYFRARGGLESVMEGTKEIIEEYPPTEEIEKLKKIKEDISEKIKQLKMEKYVQAILEEKGLIIRFTEPILFDKGSAELKSDAFLLLKEIADILKNIPNKLRIEGYTCDLPINTFKYPSNWELSVARAISVAKFLIKEKVPPPQIYVVGYGEYNPLYPNTTEENRKKNRRVDLVILNPSFSI